MISWRGSASQLIIHRRWADQFRWRIMSKRLGSERSSCRAWILISAVSVIPWVGGCRAPRQASSSPPEGSSQQLEQAGGITVREAIDAIYDFSWGRHFGTIRQVDGQEMVETCASIYSSRIRSGWGPNRALEHLRGNSGAWLIVEVVGSELQLTYIGAVPCVDGMRSWRAPLGQDAQK